MLFQTVREEYGRPLLHARANVYEDIVVVLQKAQGVEQMTDIEYRRMRHAIANNHIEVLDKWIRNICDVYLLEAVA